MSAPQNNRMKLTGSAMFKQPRPQQLNSVFDPRGE